MAADQPPYHDEVARRLLVGLLLLVVGLPGCTYERSEPGLFRERAPSPRPSGRAQPAELPPRPTNPALPVAGEQIWTTADGNQITVRIAVHAVRRGPGFTVLDWSITPLHAPGVRFGDALPGSPDFGLATGAGSNVGVVLIDPTAQRVYRPLHHVSRRVFNHCLCTPLWLAQQSMRIGETALMQVAFPELPARAGFVDVAFATVPPVFHVPITPAERMPTPQAATDLARPADQPAPVSSAVTFANPGRSGGRLSIQVDRIVAGPGLTAMSWILRSVGSEADSRLDAIGPPVTSELPTEVSLVNSYPTDGLRLRAPGGPTLSASWMTADIYGRPGFECLCTELGLWARDLRSGNGSATVVTLYPPLPAGTTSIDVILPGVSEVARLPVGPAADAALNLGGPVSASKGAWTFGDGDPPRIWATIDWPVPLPDPAQLDDYASRDETIAVLPRP